MFNRFVRGDATRSAGVHCGIGLALVRGVSEALGLDVVAENTADGGVSFAVNRRAARAGAAGRHPSLGLTISAGHTSSR